MVILRSAEATWAGTVSDGSGRIQLQSGALEAPFSLKARAPHGPERTSTPSQQASNARGSTMGTRDDNVSDPTATHPRQMWTNFARLLADRNYLGYLLTFSLS